MTEGHDNQPEQGREIKRIPLSELRIGMFLVDDLYDGGGRLLLGGGLLIVSPHQIALAQQAHAETVAIDLSKYTKPEALAPPEPPSENGETEAEREASLLAKEFTAANELMQAAVIEAGNIIEAARSGQKLDIEKVQALVGAIVNSVCEHSRVLPLLLHLHEAQDHMFKHSVGACVLSVLIAKAAGMGQEQTLQAGVAGLLHDIGKVEVPPAIINKPEPLDPRDWRLVKRHPALGAELLERSGDLPQDVLRAVRQHHERIDGEGYPLEMPGSQICALARIVAIAEAYDAMVSATPYNKPKIPFRAVLEVFRNRGAQFDEQFASLFIAKIGVYPVGSFVKTSENELGIVIGYQPDALQQPKLFVVFDQERRKLHPGAKLVDLATAQPGEAGGGPMVLGAGDPALWDVSAKDYLFNLM